MATKSSWRTDPDIQLAKHVAEQKKAEAAIIFWFTPDKTGVGFGGASYGVDGDICGEIGCVLDEIMDLIECGSIPMDDLANAIQEQPLKHNGE